jgi:hypothetical protein
MPIIALGAYFLARFKIIKYRSCVDVNGVGCIIIFTLAKNEYLFIRYMFCPFIKVLF